MDEAKQGVINTILQDRKEDIDNLNHRKMMISAKLGELRSQTLDKIKKTCYSQYIWFIKNGTVRETSKGFDLSIHDSTNPEEASFKIKQFDDCVNNNNLSIDGILTSLGDDSKIKASYSKCSRLCLLKLDEQFEGCFRECLNGYTGSMSEMFKDTEEKLDKYKV
jgi:hypothetical protein